MKIQKHTDLEVYKKGFDASMRIFNLSTQSRFQKKKHIP
jgi:hypothetical protein